MGLQGKAGRLTLRDLDFSYHVIHQESQTKQTSERRSQVAALVAQMVKNLPVIWETFVRSLGWEDPLEKEMATDSVSPVSPSICHEVMGPGAMIFVF